MYIRKVQDDGKDFLLLQYLAEQCGDLDIHTAYTYWSVCHFFNSYSFVLMDEKKPVGYIMGLCNEERGFIWQIGILENYRRKKLSYILINAALAAMQEHGIFRVQLSIESSNNSSNFAFSNYCMRNGLEMRMIGSIGAGENKLKREELFEICFENSIVVSK